MMWFKQRFWDRFHHLFAHPWCTINKMTIIGVPRLATLFQVSMDVKHRRIVSRIVPHAAPGTCHRLLQRPLSLQGDMGFVVLRDT